MGRKGVWRVLGTQGAIMAKMKSLRRVVQNKFKKSTEMPIRKASGRPTQRSSFLLGGFEQWSDMTGQILRAHSGYCTEKRAHRADRLIQEPQLRDLHTDAASGERGSHQRSSSWRWW